MDIVEQLKRLQAGKLGPYPDREIWSQAITEIERLRRVRRPMSEAPRRIQRQRMKGWRMPPNTVCVTRPGKWGNPFVVGLTYQTVAAGEIIVEDAAHAVRLHRPIAWCQAEEIKRELKGKNLACWCRLDQPCHADELIEIANSHT